MAARAGIARANAMPSLDVNLTYVAPGPVAEAFWLKRNEYEDADVQLIRGPVGSGKTTACSSKLLKMACEQTPNARGERLSRWFIVRRTYEDLRKTTVNDWDEQWSHSQLNSFRHFTRSPLIDRFHFTLPDGTVVKAHFDFVALDREEDIERIRGANYTGGWCNEVKQLLLVHMEDLTARAGRYPSGAQGGVDCDPEIAVVLADTNAPDTEHWYAKKEVDMPANPGWDFYVQPGAVHKDNLDDQDEEWKINPNAENLMNLPGGEKYYRRLLRTLNSSQDRIRVEVGNNFGFIKAGKPVYPEYNDITHCTDRAVYDRNLPLLLGGDGGLTPAVVLCQLSDRGQLRVIDELVAEEMAVKQFWRDVVKPHLAANYSDAEIGLAWHDPAGNNRGEGEGKTAINILNDTYLEYDDPTRLNLGFFVEGAETNDPTLRQGAVRGYLNRMIDGRPAFLIHPKCKMLRQGFNGKYAFRKIKVAGPERFHLEPDKNMFSHVHDALQYVSVGAAGGHVLNVKQEWTPGREELIGATHADAVTGY